MASTTRQRRPSSSDQSSSSETYSKLDKPGRSDGREEVDKRLGWTLPLFALGMLRYMSATSNIIHDCDEVFNYWEPLHYLLFKSGFQTWEYRSRTPPLYAYTLYVYLCFACMCLLWFISREKSEWVVKCSVIFKFVHLFIYLWSGGTGNQGLYLSRLTHVTWLSCLCLGIKLNLFL